MNMFRRKNNSNSNNDSSTYDHSNNDINRPKSMQKQVYKQGRTQEKVVVHTKLLLDQLQNCFEMFDGFAPAVMKRNKGKKVSLAEMQGRNSAVVGSINIFGSMCVVEQQRHKNERAFNIASHKLKTYVQGLGQPEYEILKPFLEYINCAVNGVKVPALPAIEVDIKQWNSKNASSIVSGLLGTGHVIEKRLDEYRKNAKEIDQELDQEWKKNGKNCANISSANRNGNGNGTHLPDAKSMYSHAGANVKLAYGFKNNNQFANAPLQAQLECQGEHDYEQPHNLTCNNKPLQQQRSELEDEPIEESSGDSDSDIDMDGVGKDNKNEENVQSSAVIQQHIPSNASASAVDIVINQSKQDNDH